MMRAARIVAAAWGASVKGAGFNAIDPGVNVRQRAGRPPFLIANRAIALP